MSSAIDKLIVDEHLPSDYRRTVDAYWRALSEAIDERALDGPVVVGINGAQGSGKTTLCQFLEVLLVEHNQRSATLSIHDRGRIFEPYRRGTHERRVAGAGLGLTICRSFVERHGGVIGVAPAAGGNRFHFTIPAMTLPATTVS
jgi:nitrogen fixation/metabolism regulation signal transduction histidine kinase